MMPRGLAQEKAKAGIARMHLHPTEIVGNTSGALLLGFYQFFVHFVLGQVQELSMVRNFLYIVVHRSDVPTQEFINTAVTLVLERVNENS